MFAGVFSTFRTKYNGFGEDLYGFILINIRKVPSKALISESQWFNLSEGFKRAFRRYKDEELPKKKIRFEATMESNKKGYYTYRDNVLISGPEDIEYKLLRPTKIKIFD